MFNRCFLALLLVAAILWKIKQKYDMYRRRQRLFVEMQQMANRAFSQVLVEIERRDMNTIETDNIDAEANNSRKKKKKKVSLMFFFADGTMLKSRYDRGGEEEGIEHTIFFFSSNFPYL